MAALQPPLFQGSMSERSLGKHKSGRRESRLRGSLLQKKVPDQRRSTLADDEFETIGQSQKPPAAAQSTQLADPIRVHQHAPMNAFKLGASKALRQTAETVHGPVLPACGENPDDLSISLERVHVVQVEKVVVLRMASHQLGDRPGFAPVQRAQGSLHSKGTLQGPAPGSAGPVQGRSEAALTDRLEQVVHGSDLEGVEGMLGIRGHEHDGRQGTPEPSDHLESVHDRHLDVQEHQIRLQMADLPQRRLPAVRFAHDLDVFHGGQPFQQHSAGQRLIVHDQYTQFFPGHVTRPLKRRSGGIDPEFYQLFPQVRAPIPGRRVQGD